MARRIWRIEPCAPTLTAQEQTQLGISPLVASMLARRGIQDMAAALRFLEGGLADLYSPSLLPEADKAAQRLKEAICKHEKILIYGDYDVDGITSTALILRVLRKLNVKDIMYFIPRRLEEGYGLNRSVLEKAVKHGCRLVVTVDCGISGNTEAAYLKDNGVDLIITDHHEPPEELPAAYAIVNPKVPAVNYPCPYLAGVGVAFKFLQALAEYYPEIRPGMEENLDLVAIGTIADVVPLLDENRILVREGLKRLANSTNLGLQTLLHRIGLEPPLTAEQVGYILGPRINACGRLNTPTMALQLFLATDPVEAVRLADQLEEANRKRQNVEEKVMAEALAMVESDFDPKRDYALVLAGEGWHPGVIGIVASRITERYYRPTVMIGVENGIGKGSARSIPGFHLFRALQGCSERLVRFGGHEMAAGLTIEAEEISEFRSAFNALASQELTTDKLQPVLFAEDEIRLEQVNMALIDELLRLAPFGVGNPAPVLIARNLQVLFGKAVGEGARHLKLKLSDGRSSRNGIGFNLGRFTDEVLQAERVDVAFTAEKNTWNDVTDVQLVIKDIQTRALMEEETA